MKNIFISLLKLAYPLILSGIAQNSVYFFETIFLSKLGTDVLAAGSLVSWLAASFIVSLGENKQGFDEHLRGILQQQTADAA